MASEILWIEFILWVENPFFDDGLESIKSDDQMKKVSLEIFQFHFSETTHKSKANTLTNWREFHQQSFEKAFLWWQIRIHQIQWLITKLDQWWWWWPLWWWWRCQIQIDQIQWWITELDLDYRVRFHFHFWRPQIFFIFISDDLRYFHFHF